MDAFRLARYPFLPESSEHIRQMDISLEELLSDPAYERARILGIERARTCVEGKSLRIPIADELEAEIALLSFVIAKIVISSTEDPYVIRRYALAEALNACRSMEIEESDVLMNIAGFFEFDAHTEDGEFRVHISTYLKNMPTRKQEWKLVNRTVDKGYVILRKGEFIRLLQEALRDFIEKHISGVQVDDEIKKTLKKPIDEIRFIAEAQKAKFEMKGFGRINPERFPPCMKKLIAMAQQGMNVPHAGRFALTAFLYKIGMSSEDILKLFGGSPDFDESKTRYQVEHITGKISKTEYTPPSCATMKTYGICFDPDELCRRINHPVSYYSKSR